MVGNFLIMLENLKTDALKTSFNRVIQKTVELTGYLIGKKISNKITRISQNSQQNNLEAVTND